MPVVFVMPVVRPRVIVPVAPVVPVAQRDARLAIRGAANRGIRRKPNSRGGDNRKHDNQETHEGENTISHKASFIRAVPAVCSKKNTPSKDMSEKVSIFSWLSTNQEGYGCPTEGAFPPGRAFLRFSGPASKNAPRNPLFPDADKPNRRCRGCRVPEHALRSKLFRQRPRDAAPRAGFRLGAQTVNVFLHLPFVFFLAYCSPTGCFFTAWTVFFAIPPTKEFL